ncbi:hypothetical protein KR222_005713 [Zaprionus bogoriensis]|nr:hypothetical protein KR222_005713 [Zaprionus bogoriensis]
MLRQGQLAYVLLIVQLLVLPVYHALPVSNPEIPNKAANSPNSVLSQQQHKTSSAGQDAHLNSLNAFAGNYDNLPTAAQSQQSTESGFKPSYKIPEMETNFTPMQGSSLGDGTSLTSLPSTPMLMQYLPTQTLQDGSGTVQYLQLIPTRPIIVPISPYLTAAASGAIQPPAPALTPNAGATVDYATRGPAVQLGALPANTGVTGLHYAAAGLQGYASAISPMAAYRGSYRINREAKDKPFSGAFSLNLNEYLPSALVGHDAAATGTVAHPNTQVFIRARP